MEVGEFTQMQCLLWIIQTAKFSRANSHLSSMTILHILLQKKPKISPQTTQHLAYSTEGENEVPSKDRGPVGSVCQELVVSVYAEVWILREASVLTT